jgi:transposase InsO family protein
MNPNAENLALFRYGLIAPLAIEPLARGELTRRTEEIASRQYDLPDGQRRAFSVDTLLEWAKRHRQGGLEALAPKPRQDRGQMRAITPPLATLIERLKRENPHRTGTTLLRELALSSGNNEPPLSASTLYRFLKQRGLSEREPLAPQARRKFEAERAHQIWQADMLFGPWGRRPGGGRMQVFLHATLDDASRLIPHAQFYPRQGLDACLDCLRQARAARGVPTRLYIDNAKMYRSPPLARIAASLGTLIIHSRPYRPEGRGKIERCFRTLREQFPANLDPKRLLSLDQLNERLHAWVEGVYHRTAHSALGTTPLLRWQKDIEHGRQPPPGADLRRLFFHRLDRLVRRDSTFLLRNRLSEAPARLAGHTVEVRFDPADADAVEVRFEGKLQAVARPLDAVVNGQLPSPKPAPAPAPQPTGIDFVELVHEKKQEDDDEEDVPW